MQQNIGMVYVSQVVAPCDAKWTSYDQGKRERQNQGGADESWQIHFLEISTKLCEQISVVCLFPANSRVDDFATKNVRPYLIAIHIFQIYYGVPRFILCSGYMASEIRWFLQLVTLILILWFSKLLLVHICSRDQNHCGCLVKLCGCPENICGCPF